MKENWEIKKLGEVVEIINGRSQSAVISENGKYPIYGSAGNLMGLATDYLCKEGTTIIGRKGNISNPIYIEEKFWNVDTAFGLYPKCGYSTKFINYLCQTIDFKSRNKGTTIPSLVKTDLLNIDVSFNSSLPEQRRIVSILDECFAAIDKAKANAEQNLKNAKELFESYLQGVFEKKGLNRDSNDFLDDPDSNNSKKSSNQANQRNQGSDKGDGWEERVLGDLCLLITKGSSPKWQGIKYVDEPGILFVTSENVGEGKMLLETKKYVEEKFNQKDKKSILKKGDVLTNIVGASIGRTAIYDIDDVANINQAVCILRCNPKLIDNVFLMNLLNSPFLRKILHDNEVNTARANLSLGFFNKLTIPCPSIKDQQTIVRQLDALRTETQKLEAVYQKKLADLEELKKSILQKAFAGELEMENAVEV